jgi:hypothetical protein
VWEGYAQIPDARDREEAWLIIRSLVDDPIPAGAEANHWESGGVVWAGYSIDFSSGHGFIPYAPVEAEGEEVIRLWPVVWYPEGL